MDEEDSLAFYWSLPWSFSPFRSFVRFVRLKIRKIEASFC